MSEQYKDQLIIPNQYKKSIEQKYNNLVTALALIESDAEKKKTVEDMIDSLSSPDFNPIFYRTWNLVDDARLINKPHVEAEWEQEDRTQETLDLLKNKINDYESFDWNDVLNIQNHFLKVNNYKWIKTWIRTHGVSFLESAAPKHIASIVECLFPVSTTNKDELLAFFRRIQIIHPLSDLNGRTFGTIVAHLYHRWIKDF